MNHVERFRAVMNFQPVDRLPRWEWAMWWDETIAPLARRGPAARAEVQPGLRHRPVLRPRPLPAVLVQHHRPDDRGHAASRRGHRRRTWTTTCASGRSSFPTTTRRSRRCAAWAERQRRGEAVVWCTLEGFFWFPRTLMGFEQAHAAPSTTSRSCCTGSTSDLLEFNLGLLDQMRRGLRADVHDHRRGHVLQPRPDDLEAASSTSSSRRTTGSSCRGCRSASIIADRGHRRRRDAAGAVAAARWAWRACCRWSARRAWTACELRRQFPALRMVGHFDKMMMNRGEAAMRAEFERLAAADEDRRLHPQRRPPDAARRLARAVPRLSQAAGRIHGALAVT